MIMYPYWFIIDAKGKMLMTGEKRCGIGGEFSVLEFWILKFWINENLFHFSLCILFTLSRKHSPIHFSVEKLNRTFCHLQSQN